MTKLSTQLTAWLEGAANDLDASHDGASALLPGLAETGVFRIGVPEALGGSGGDVTDAVAAIASVSQVSLAAGFVFWGHRSFIEYLLQSPNEKLRDRLLPDLLAGRRAGATGLSNAMKFLSGIEPLQILATPHGDDLAINGKMPWVTNLRQEGFDVAAAIEGDDGRPAFIASVSSDSAGLQRSSDLALMGMRASSTAAVNLTEVRITPDDIIAADARAWLPIVRPAFLGLQCGMSLGLAQRALAETSARLKSGRDALKPELDACTIDLADCETRLDSGLIDGRFVQAPAELFRIRIRLAEIVAAAVHLELCASGGGAYLSEPGKGFQRRLREAAFIPIITPSLVQLKSALLAHAPRQSVAEAV